MKPEFTQEQLRYLAELLAIEPCHVTGEHQPDHHLTSNHICDIQRRGAWGRAMHELGFDHTNPRRRLHENCGWCTGPDGDLHLAWVTGELHNGPKRTGWRLSEAAALIGVERAWLKVYLRENRYPVPKDCPSSGLGCERFAPGWCPDGKCRIAVELR